MDRQDELKEDETIAEFVLTDEEMMIILKGLDLYGYSMMLAGEAEEVMKIRAIVLKVLTQLPRQDLNS